jgi:apolipoprotein D and lipocalin family protein
MKTIALFCYFSVVLIADVCCQPLQTVEKVDLEKYVGRWYDIASYPASFQKDCRCTTADYELVPGKKYISVMNRCVKFKKGRSSISVARGKAFVVEGTNNTRLKVQFFWPFRGDYYIIGLAEDYSWAIVGHPGRKYLWILSRDSFMPTDTYNQVLALIRKSGYDLKPLRKTPQNCDNPE